VLIKYRGFVWFSNEQNTGFVSAKNLRCQVKEEDIFFKQTKNCAKALKKFFSNPN
jgi:hypothetical protein